MDEKTLQVYNKNAAHYVQDWLSQPAPVEIYDIAEKFFEKKAPTADIGSGSGRDTHWLNENGYPCIGYDASEGLLKEARQRFPKCIFKKATLPWLKEIEAKQFKNVLCETVLQHLPTSQHEESLKNLFRILMPGGVLSLTCRHPRATIENRESDERLYTLVDPKVVHEVAQQQGITLLHEKTLTSPSSGKTISQYVFRL